MRTILNNFTIVNEGRAGNGCVVIEDGLIKKVVYRNTADTSGKTPVLFSPEDKVIEGGEGAFLLPGVIDDQVHFREPGAISKGCIASESAAAVLGGTTSYMDMPNNNPPVCSLEALEEKYATAARNSVANYSFYLGADNENFEELKGVDPQKVCGIKVFMGSSTGNMLVDSQQTLERIFGIRNILIATHCEEEATIRKNMEDARMRWGEDIPFNAHPLIRSREACIKSTEKALALAIKNGTRLHILHVSTAEEIEMITKAKAMNPLITFEVCVHYLWFDSRDYDRYGSHIKCNPAIKDASDREAIISAVRNSLADAVATDHAPHLYEEKQNTYLKAPSGLPTIQHSLQMMLELSEKGFFPIEQVVSSMSHSPADIFRIDRRGYIREGYHADLVIARKTPYTVSKENIAYRCGWSPLEGHTFHYTITDTFVNGVQTVENSRLTGAKSSARLRFNR